MEGQGMYQKRAEKSDMSMGNIMGLDLQNPSETAFELAALPQREVAMLLKNGGEGSVDVGEGALEIKLRVSLKHEERRVRRLALSPWNMHGPPGTVGICPASGSQVICGPHSSMVI